MTDRRQTDMMAHRKLSLPLRNEHFKKFLFTLEPPRKLFCVQWWLNNNLPLQSSLNCQYAYCFPHPPSLPLEMPLPLNMGFPPHPLMIEFPTSPSRWSPPPPQHDPPSTSPLKMVSTNPPHGFPNPPDQVVSPPHPSRWPSSKRLTWPRSMQSFVLLAFFVHFYSFYAKKMQINLSHGHFLATLHFLSREVTPTDKYVCRYVRGPVRASVPASVLAVHLCRSSEHLLDSSIVSLGFWFSEPIFPSSI